MKRLPLLFLSILLLSTMLSSPTRAIGSIGLYADPGAGVCAAPSMPFQVSTVYVIHVLSPGATMSSWRILNNTGMTGLTSSCGQLSITGNVWDGITVLYGSCLSGTFVICQVELFNLSSTPIPGCYQLEVVGYPDPQPTVVDCNETEWEVSGGFFTFDIEGKENCWDCSTPTEQNTWGKVKSLYR